jgi:1-acyl-sn-glycerol-3-phosphate acyltransferase
VSPTAPAQTDKPYYTPGIDDELWRTKLLPFTQALIRLRYFSFDVEGTEHLPRDRRVVYASNHAGWFALDAFFIALAVRQALGPERIPLFATQESALALPKVGDFLRRTCGVPASWFRRPERLPPEIQAWGLFPEGVEGNCKPFWQAYRMRDWKRGAVRVAQAIGAPVVPVAVLGGEECLPVAWTVRLLEPLIGSAFGLPLSLVPLPTRWRVVFHEPVETAHLGRNASQDAQLGLTRSIQETVQTTLDRHAREYPLARLSSRVAWARDHLPLVPRR